MLKGSKKVQQKAKLKAMDLSTKDRNDQNQEKKFYCPTEGCVFSKGYGKSFKKKMLVDQVSNFDNILRVF